jgi:cytoskeleton protein RodZ
VDSLGTRLKQERERRGMTLEEIAVSTKIGTRMLAALEEGKYEQLPGGIFNKGFVRAYARQLQLDEEQAVADYMTATGTPVAEGQPVAVMEALAAHAVETRGDRRNLLDTLPWGKLAIFLLLIAIGLTVWGPRMAPSDRHRQNTPPRSSEAAQNPVARSFF